MIPILPTRPELDHHCLDQCQSSEDTSNLVHVRIARCFFSRKMYSLDDTQKQRLRLASLPREIQGSREMVFVQCPADELPPVVIAAGAFGW